MSKSGFGFALCAMLFALSLPVDSLARPGGNIKGISRLTRELAGKRLELLTEVVPGIGRLGVLWDASSEGSKISFKEYQAAGRRIEVAIAIPRSARPEAGPRRISLWIEPGGLISYSSSDG